MAEGKRYYWLKLLDDFFDSKRIKKLRKLAGGDTYLIIYLKMQLRSIKTEGILTYTGLESDMAEEIALDIDEEPDNVRVTLQYLLSCGLAETNGNSDILLPSAVESTGSEGSSARRMRELRAREASRCDALPSQGDPPVKHALPSGDGETEKESESEKDIEAPRRRGGVFRGFAGEDRELSLALKEFNDFRNKKKKPLTDEAKERLCRKLETFPREQWIPIILQSIDQGWTDLYPLKAAETGETAKPASANRNAPASNAPDKWAKDETFRGAVAELLSGQERKEELE